MGFIQSEGFKNQVTDINRNEYSFDLKKNIERLEIQQNGDPAFYFLAIFSFIEGYFRSKNPEFDFDARNKDQNNKSWTLFNILLNVENVARNDTHLSLDKQIAMKENLSFLRELGCLSDDSSKTHTTNLKYYISADRIRHCFTDQKYETLCAAIEQFIKFSENFGFKNEKIESLDKNKIIFKDRINRVRTKETLELQENIKQKEKELQKMLDENASLKERISELEEHPNENNNLEKMDIDIQEYYLKKEELKSNQKMLSLYAKSWRNYQSMLSLLTDEQVSILNKILDSINSNQKENFLIQGGPGTGKTIILINILQSLPTKDLYLLTYTKSLNKYNKYIAQNVYFKNTEYSKEDVSDQIKDFDSFLQKRAEIILEREIFKPDAKSDYSDTYSKQIKKIIQEEIDQKNTAYIYSQAINEVWNLTPSKESYIDHTYSYGEDNPITDPVEIEKRTKDWNSIKKLEEILSKKEKQVIPLEFAAYLLSLSKEILPETKQIFKLENGIPDNQKVNYLLVDELQDLSNAKINAIANLTRKNFVLTGDVAQSVFIRKALSWNEAMELPLNAFEPLSKNFRSTFAIQDLANDFRKNANFIIKDEDVTSEGFMPGPTPDYSILTSTDDTLNAIKNRIKVLKEELYFSNKDFCIVIPEEDKIQDIKNFIGKEFPILDMEDPEYTPETDCIRLSTVKYVKGIDCPVILLLLNENFLNYRLNGNLDENSQMNGIYAAITRAMNVLSIFIDNSSRFLENNEKSSVSKFLQVLTKDGINYNL